MKLIYEVVDGIGKDLIMDIHSHWVHLGFHRAIVISTDKETNQMIATLSTARRFICDMFAEPLDLMPYFDECKDTVIELLAKAVADGHLIVKEYDHLDNKECLVERFLKYIDSPSIADSHLAYNETMADMGNHISDFDWQLYFKKIIKEGKLKHIKCKDAGELELSIDDTWLPKIAKAATNWLNKQGESQELVKQTFKTYNMWSTNITMYLDESLNVRCSNAEIIRHKHKGEVK